MKIKYNAPVTLTFSIICALVLGLTTMLGNGFLQTFFMTYNSGWLNPMTYLRLFTHIFGHSGWEHFFNNMSFILLLGPMLEEKYGEKNLVVLIAITSVVSGVLNNILFPTVALCGASGIVFMMIVLSSVTSIGEKTIPLTLILIVLIYLGKELYNAIVITDSISQFTHIIGGVCGGTFGFLLPKKKHHR